MIAIVLAALLWGTTGTAATLLPPAVSPLATGAATMSVGGMLLAATAPRRAAAIARDRGALPWLALGAAGVVAYPLAFYSSMSLAGVAIGNVVSLGTAPVFAAVLELGLDPRGRRRAPTRRWVASAAVALGGVAVLALAGSGGHDERSGAAPAAGGERVLLGICLGLVAGLAFAAYTYAAARIIARGHDSRGAMGAQFGVGGLALLPVLVALGGPLLVSAPGSVPTTPLSEMLGPPHPLAVAAYLALGPMFVAYLLYGRGLRTVASSRATTVTLLEPLVATLLAVVAVGERLAPTAWVGLAMVLAGIVAVATEPRRPATSP